MLKVKLFFTYQCDHTSVQ